MLVAPELKASARAGSQVRRRRVLFACSGLTAGGAGALRVAAFRPHVVFTQSINAHIVGHLFTRRAGDVRVANEHAGPGSPTRLHQDLLIRLVASRVDGVIAVSNGAGSKIGQTRSPGQDAGHLQRRRLSGTGRARRIGTCSSRLSARGVPRPLHRHAPSGEDRSLVRLGRPESASRRSSCAGPRGRRRSGAGAPEGAGRCRRCGSSARAPKIINAAPVSCSRATEGRSDAASRSDGVREACDRRGCRWGGLSRRTRHDRNPRARSR